MSSARKRYVPQTIGEIIDLIGSMTLDAPDFVDKDGYSPGMSIDREFSTLNESFDVVRKRIGEDSYKKLTELSNRARAHFEADQEDVTEDGIKGRDCFLEMEDILKATARRKPRV